VRIRFALRATALAIIIVRAAACDPCFGTVECTTEPRLTIDGQIVRPESGRGVGGVRIDMLRMGGVRLSADSASTVTDSDGHWRISVPADAPGTATVDVAVSSEESAYRVRGLVMKTNTVNGESNLLERWVATPYFPISAELRRRGGTGEVLANGNVLFQRTGGPAIFGAGVSGDAASAITDGTGRAALFGYANPVFASSLDTLVGTLTVSLASGETITGRNFRLIPDHVYHPPLHVIVAGVGPAINWVLITRNRATSAPQGGVTVRFTRTAGIAITPQSFTVVSSALGHVVVPARALEPGTLIGDLEIIPPPPGSPFTIRGYRFPTYDEDDNRFLAFVETMPYMPYFFGVKVGETGLSDVLVEFKRTGGIPLLNDVVTARSHLGAFGLHPIPLAQGEVIGDLTIHAPAPYRSFIVHNLRLATVDGEGIMPDKLIWVWGLDLPPSGPPGTTVELLPPGPP
jgi:hypothetical protein